MEGEVKLSVRDRTLLAELSGDIDHHSARGWREGIDAMLFRARPELLILDFSRVKFMDSSGIGLIIGRAELCGGIGCRVLVSGASRTVRKLLMLSGVEKITNVTVQNGEGR